MRGRELHLLPERVVHRGRLRPRGSQEVLQSVHVLPTENLLLGTRSCTVRERSGPMETRSVDVSSEVADGLAEAIDAQIAAIRAGGGTVISVQLTGPRAATISYTEG